MGEFSRSNLQNMDLWGIVLECVALWNILPLTSSCNVRCRFCSHFQNPPGVESWSLPAISLDLAEEAIELINPGKPVVIGESVTKIMEGEPLVHPFFDIILQQINSRYPGIEIRLTTNGNLLDKKKIDFLSSLDNLVVTLSINSANVEKRRHLMNDSLAETAVLSPVLLQEACIPYHGSIVAMPQITGWDDLSDTIEYLDRHGASTIRVFSPGYTRYSSPELKVSKDFRERLSNFIDHMRQRVAAPVTLEPPLIDDLNAGVAGVMRDSPASKCGMKPGDIITAVNGDCVVSRVDAFRRILKSKDPIIEYRRQGDIYINKLSKEKNSPSGLVFDYDFDPVIINKIFAAIRREKASKTLLLASEMGYPAIKLALDKMCNDHDKEGVLVVPVKNRFFGGSIGCAGLLTVTDFMGALERYGSGADLAILPGRAFDASGRDITGRSYLDLKQDNGPMIKLLNF